jgi:hypothetical protein
MNKQTLRQNFGPILLLTLIAGLLALPTIHYGYLLEDYKYLRSYSLPEIAETFYAHWEPLQVETKGYRPFHSVQYALFYLVFGGNPTVNHILQIGLFIICVLLIYALFFRCTDDLTAAFWGALTYACLGTMAWQVSWLVNRQHLLLIIFFALMLIFYDRFLLTELKRNYFISITLFLFALLLKESSVTYPLIVLLFAVLVRKKTITSQLKKLAPFFLILVIFIIVRGIVVTTIPESNPWPPPLPSDPLSILLIYARALLGTLLQTPRIFNPGDDFPVNEHGWNSPWDYAGLISLIGFFAIGGFILFKRLPKSRFALGLSILLLANILVAAWYRTNRLFIGSIGVALMIGMMVSGIFKSLTAGRILPKAILSLIALLCFISYLSINLVVFFKIERALRPYGHLSLTWDSWAYDEHIYWMEKTGYLTISGYQMELLKEKLRQTGRREWVDKLQ